MYINRITSDAAESLEDEVFTGSEITTDLIDTLVRRLDGQHHTSVNMVAGKDSYMGITGDARIGLLVFQTADNLSFHNLLSDQPDNHERVILAAGGQPGDYERRYLADVSKAVTAAQRYAATGELAKELQWEADLAE